MDTPTDASLVSIYRDKPASYFANARNDFVDLLSTGTQSAILELGCGSGGTGRAALAAGKAGHYVGIELNPDAAKLAAQNLSEVIVGDVQEVDLTSYASMFDALIISEVLEHVTDPWRTMERLSACLKPGAQVFASSPNIAHWGVIVGLLQGRFRYKDAGVMDRTHLRWFTPESYRSLFEAAGIDVDTVRGMRRPGWKAAMFNAITGKRFDHLFMAQIVVGGRKR
ncbi:class I SAM-dependent methyltransferase [Phenylobacterium koreense]|uniref:2-polyprenyl-3-methyl-5-hydroxy-6-metoxy-1, 4-benzoquinol methylase n=1 Tax=Phenylobacterium koreense TaxID=266125 RepID=A0ABV2EM42_9CAUL